MVYTVIDPSWIPSISDILHCPLEFVAIGFCSAHRALHTGVETAKKFVKLMVKLSVAQTSCTLVAQHVAQKAPNVCRHSPNVLSPKRLSLKWFVAQMTVDRLTK